MPKKRSFPGWKMTIIFLAAASLFAVSATIIGCASTPATPTSVATKPPAAATAATQAPTATQPPAPTATPRKVEKASLMLDWSLSIYHALFWGGYEQGFFRDQGIDLTIQDGQGSGTTVKMVMAKNADFGFADGAEMSMGVAQGFPVRMVANAFRSSPQAFWYLKKTGIKTPKDFEGKVFGAIPSYGGGEAIIKAFMEANGADANKVKSITTDFATKTALGLQGKTDINIGWNRKDPLVFAEDGYEVESMRYADWNFNMVGHGVLVHNDLIKANPDLVKRFVAASVKSWQWAKDHPEEAVKAAQKNRPEGKMGVKNFDTAVKIFKTDLELLYSKNTEGWPLGKMSDKDWQSTLDIQKKTGLISSPPKLQDIYTNEFLPN